MKLYGNLINRMEENMKGKELEVGLGVTEYMYSDRNAYEIVEVQDDKHFKMRKYSVKHNGNYGSQDWELISDESNPIYDMVYRYNKWYQRIAYTRESIERTMKEDGVVLLDKKTFDKAMKDGVAYKYIEKKIVVGKADYYYDFEF